MKHITCYLDFISPFAWLAFDELPTVLMGQSYSVTYQPLLFAALLKHHGQLGPAEIPAKRDWTYRQVQWLAHSKGTRLDLPATHPFNPLALLRLAVATDPSGTPNRYVCETLFKHVWQGGLDAADPTRLTDLAAQLQPPRDPQSQAVKDQLQQHAQDAIALGIFGVPSFVVDGKVFWGLDSLPMLRGYLQGDSWFNTSQWDAAAQLPRGVVRTKGG